MGIQQNKKSKLKNVTGFFKKLFSRVSYSLKRIWSQRKSKKNELRKLSSSSLSESQNLENKILLPEKMSDLKPASPISESDYPLELPLRDSFNPISESKSPNEKGKIKSPTPEPSNSGNDEATNLDLERIKFSPSREERVKKPEGRQSPILTEPPNVNAEEVSKLDEGGIQSSAREEVQAGKLEVNEGSGPTEPPTVGGGEVSKLDEIGVNPSPQEEIINQDSGGGETPLPSKPPSDGEEGVLKLDEVSTILSPPQESFEQESEDKKVSASLEPPSTVVEEVSKPDEGGIKSSLQEESLVEDQAGGEAPAPPETPSAGDEEEDIYRNARFRPILSPDKKEKPRKGKPKPSPPKILKIKIEDISHPKPYYGLRQRRSNTGNQKSEDVQKEPKPSSFQKEKPFVIIDFQRDDLFLVVPLNKIPKEIKQISLFCSINIEEYNKEIDRDIDSGEDNLWEQILPSCIEQYYITIHLNHQPSYGFKYSSDTPHWFFFKETINGNLKLLRNPEKLPRDYLWVLLNTNFTVNNAKIIEIRERLYWGGYKLAKVDLRTLDKLEIINVESGALKGYPIESSFEIIGDFHNFSLVPNYIYVITENYLQLMENAGEGEDNLESREYNVEIRLAEEDREFFYSEIWSNHDDLKIDLLNSGLKPGGDYQLAVMEKRKGYSSWVCGFKWLPNFNIIFPFGEDYIFPACRGHTANQVIVTIPKPQELIKIIPPEKIIVKIEEKQSNIEYNLTIDAGTDEISLVIGDPLKEKYQTDIPLSLKRVRWKLGAQNKWNDTPFKIQKADLVLGKDSVLILKNIEDSNAKANLVLDGIVLQELKLIHEGDFFLFRLNALYDTIKLHRKDLILELTIPGMIDEERIAPIIFENEIRTWESLNLLGNCILEKVHDFPLKKLFEIFNELFEKLPEYGAEYVEIINNFSLFSFLEENEEITLRREIQFGRMIDSLRKYFKRTNWSNVSYRDVKIWRRVFAKFQKH